MPENPNVLASLVVIDDDPEVLETVAAALQQPEIQIFPTTDSEEGLELVFSRHAQIVILDLNMPKMDGMRLLEAIVARDPAIDVFLLTGNYSPHFAVEAIKKGACDYLTKPVSVSALRAAVEGSLETIRKRRHAFQLESEMLKTFQFEAMVGRSPKMLDLYSMITRVAPHFRTVLLTGETGTGKELVARALHRKSPFAGGPFVICNCASLVDTLAESQLFGHVKGSFTGALQDAPGYFEFANKGTIFLDEIGEMPLPLQAKLLRVLQMGEVQRVGSPAVRSVDIRVIAATHRNLKQMVQKGQFREDLYYRLSMVEIKLPRLVERKEDIPLLQRYFVERFSEAYGKSIKGITRRAQNILAKYSWPGNVRELENVLGNACMMVQSDFIDASDLPPFIREGDVAVQQHDLISMEELEHRHLRKVLSEVGGNKNRAAEILGISRATLYSMLARFEKSDRHAH